MTNHTQFFSDREHIYVLYHTGQLSAQETQRRLNALDDPKPQAGWTIAAVAVLAIAGVVALAVWPK